MLKLRFDRREPFPNFDGQFPLAVHLIETLLGTLFEAMEFCSKCSNLGFESPEISLNALDFRSNCVLNDLFEVLIEV